MVLSKIQDDFRVVLSLENHCSPAQQEIMADNLQMTFGESLLSDMLADFPDTLPSPEALKFKVLVKNKKIGTLKETHERKGSDKRGDNQDKETGVKKLPGVMLFKKKKVRWSKIALALSDLVIYTKAEKFKSFQHSRLYQQFNENNSIGETQARKLSKLRVHEFIFHTRRFITRIYPKATRADSSNFNPQEFWNIGCQMVALNFQTPGLPMDLQNGKFLDNGGSGYILKPHFLRESESYFNPSNIKESMPITLTIRLISGIQLPLTHSSSNKGDTLVIIEVFGVPNDQMKQQTRVIKKNGELLIYCIELPLAFFFYTYLLFIRQGFSIMSKISYRRVPLFSRMGESLEPASLFVYVWYVR
uniref:Phosphoinositide phospholipase C n=1 Tax=Rhinopithecus bieti TaxID=61621 RepID=A0A2K6L0J7_RHIBE